MIAIAGALRFVGIDATISKINNYLVSVETRYPEIGWTGSYRSQNRWKVLKLSRYAIWLILASCGLGFGLYVWRNAPLSPPPPAVAAASAPMVSPAPLAAASLPAQMPATRHDTTRPDVLAQPAVPAEMSGSPGPGK